MLSDLGVKRVSVGSGLARVAFGAFLRASTELRNDGTFNLAACAPNVREIESFFDWCHSGDARSTIGA